MDDTKIPTSERARHVFAVDPWRGVAMPFAKLVAGSALALAGGRRRGVVGTLVASAGLVVAQHALSQLLHHVLDVMFTERPDLDRHFGAGDRDLVEEASWESFPASDPPGYTH